MSSGLCLQSYSLVDQYKSTSSLELYPKFLLALLFGSSLGVSVRFHHLVWSPRSLRYPLFALTEQDIPAGAASTTTVSERTELEDSELACMVDRNDRKNAAVDRGASIDRWLRRGWGGVG
ncbi:hypothetical protein MPTK1_5g10830 [Marchantia polymorpha subsp. ruderalis]|uniref:Uncharacterized protein n=2 Tax=Marchantia polymorpha TaxID=3197 RepID=A0AAF6BH29_MARPO|nr:hypothetical protein MARPO_0093s0004 [Marchantia polymorpha]BBN11313.1 hypothetical protein Mp_5g10830 [Marchantia polymorpha subsp. ruderalis]|eukprot:PTQ32919.1 hypothetical protein MARPO_0093s0004 [Marchantia polymorpha]